MEQPPISGFQLLMHKLNEMEKVLGAGKKPALGPSASDEFNIAKQKVNETLYAIRKKMDEKDEKISRFGNSPDTLKMGTEIKDMLITLDKQVGMMNEVLRRQMKEKKKFTAADLEMKEKHLNNFFSQVKEIKARERGVAAAGGKDMKTLVEMRAFNLDKNGKVPEGRAKGPREPERDVTAQEAAALDRFKENDKKQDAMIGQINDGLELLKGKAGTIGEQIDKQTGLINNLDQEIDVASKELESSNVKLKKILVEYRKPSKVCMDVCLVLVLLGLIAMVVKLMSS